jgi:hypothetical protein
MRHVQTLAESNARIAALRAQGFKVRILNGPWGRIVLRSKKAFTCNSHHYCSWKSVKPAPFMAKPKKRKRRATKRRAATKRRTKRRTKR